MKTEDIYVAKFSLVVHKNYIDAINSNVSMALKKTALVQKKGKYPSEKYLDLKTGKLYVASREGLSVGEIYIDSLVSFNSFVDNTKSNLPKKKVLKMYDNVVGGM